MWSNNILPLIVLFGKERNGEGNGNPLQYSCLENTMGRGACGLQSMVLQESDTTEMVKHQGEKDFWNSRYGIWKPRCAFRNN